MLEEISDSMNPIISVIIPTKGDRSSLKEVLKSLINQQIKDFEILIISDKDIDVFCDERVKLIIDEGSPGYKRNLAAKISRSEILAFLDDDAIPSEGWLCRLLNIFKENPDIALVGGPNLTPLNSSLRERCSGYIFSSFLGSAWMSARYSSKKFLRNIDERVFMSCNMAVKRSAFFDVEGFPEDMFPGEEVIFVYKLRCKGYRLHYDPKLIVYHYRRPLFLPHIRQVFSYGWSKGLTVRKMGLRIGFLSLLPTFAVCYLILLPIIIFFIKSLLLLLFYMYSLLGGFILSLAESLRLVIIHKDFKALPFLTLGFIFHHISYGIGFLKGLIIQRGGSLCGRG